MQAKETRPVKIRGDSFVLTVRENYAHARLLKRHVVFCAFEKKVTRLRATRLFARITQWKPDRSADAIEVRITRRLRNDRVIFARTWSGSNSRFRKGKKRERNVRRVEGEQGSN